MHCVDFIAKNMGRCWSGREEAKAKKNQTREQKIQDFLDAHDVWTEYVATKNIIDMARATGGRVHICHVSHPMVAQVVERSYQ